MVGEQNETQTQAVCAPFDLGRQKPHYQESLFLRDAIYHTPQQFKEKITIMRL